MLTEKSKNLYKFIEEYYPRLDSYSSSGANFTKPDFELYSRDYMKFAQNNLQDDNESKINCISFLKRAIDCQTDYFFESFGLLKMAKKRKYGVDKKLNFISNIGIFDQQALGNLNRIRNKMEHEYSIPNISDIEVYYDLCLAYVSNIEAAMIVLSWWDFDYHIRNEEDEKEFTFKFALNNEKGTTIVYKIGEENEVIVPTSEYEDFMFCFRCLYMLSIRRAYPHDNYFFDRIRFYFSESIK